MAGDVEDRAAPVIKRGTDVQTAPAEPGRNVGTARTLVRVGRTASRGSQISQRQAPLPGQRLEGAAECKSRRSQYHRSRPEEPVGKQPSHLQRRNPEGVRTSRVLTAGPVEP